MARRLIAAGLVAALLAWVGVTRVVSLIVWPATLPLKVEATFGATTVDLFPLFMKQEIRLLVGAQNENAAVQTGTIAFEIDNPDSDFTPDHPMSQYWPYVQLGVPIQVSVFWDGAWHILFTGEVSQWDPYWPYGDLSDEAKGRKGEARVSVEVSGILRRLAQGKSPLRSPLFRSLAGVAAGDYVPHEYYSGEDGADSTQIASALAGHAAATPTGPVEFAADGPTGSAPLMRVGNGFQAVLPVAPYVDAGKWVITLAVNIPSEPASTLVLAEVPVSGGTVATWRLQLVPGSPAQLEWRGFDAAGVFTGDLAFEQFSGVFSTVPTEAQFFGRWYILTAGSEQDGADVRAWLGYSDGATPANPFAQLGSTLEPGTHSALTDRIYLRSNMDDVGMGHAAVFVDPVFDPFLDGLAHSQALIGWTNEQAHNRIIRLCRELGVPLTVIGTQSARMGAQQIDTFYNLLAACAAVDVGILHEDREALPLGLVYRCNSTLYNQAPALTLSARRNELTEPFRPALDDLNVRNDVTVQRINGSEYRSLVETGPKSIQPYPNGVGTYDEKPILNLFTDEQARYNATWRTWRGTWAGMRYSRIAPDINASPDIAGPWMATRIGDLVQATDLPPQHPRTAVEALMRGYIQTLTPKSWDVVINASPAGPYKVGQAGDGTHASAWLQTGPATALAVAMKPGDTSITITPDGPLFSTTADLTLNPLEINVGGDIQRVTSISGAGPTQTLVVQRTYPKLRRAAGTIVQVHNPLIACL